MGQTPEIFNINFRIKRQVELIMHKIQARTRVWKFRQIHELQILRE